MYSDQVLTLNPKSQHLLHVMWMWFQLCPPLCKQLHTVLLDRVGFSFSGAIGDQRQCHWSGTGLHCGFYRKMESWQPWLKQSKTDVTGATLSHNFVAQLVFRDKVARVTQHVVQPFSNRATLFSEQSSSLFCATCRKDAERWLVSSCQCLCSGAV